jgi:hypothetical protein
MYIQARITPQKRVGKLCHQVYHYRIQLFPRSEYNMLCFVLNWWLLHDICVLLLFDTFHYKASDSSVCVKDETGWASSNIRLYSWILCSHIDDYEDCGLLGCKAAEFWKARRFGETYRFQL